MTYTEWVVFNPKTYKKIKTVKLSHPDGAYYKQLEPFEKSLIEQGLAAQAKSSLDQEFLKAKTFKEKLIALGW